MKCFLTNRLILIATLLGLSMTASQPLWAATVISAPPPLTELIEESLAQNKEIQSLQAQDESLKEEVSFAGSLEPDYEHKSRITLHTYMQSGITLRKRRGSRKR